MKKDLIDAADNSSKSITLNYDKDFNRTTAAYLSNEIYEKYKKYFKSENRKGMIVMKTLEEILQELGSETPFPDEVVINEDGTREPFTESGGKTYSKLINILYVVGDLAEIDVTEIVERLDDIAEGY